MFDLLNEACGLPIGINAVEFDGRSIVIVSKSIYDMRWTIVFYYTYAWL